MPTISAKRIGFVFASLVLAVLFFPIILTSCATTEQTTTAGEESLLELIAAGRTDEVRRRFANSADLNQKNAAGQSLLHIAALKNDAQMVELLLSLKADPEIKNNAGETPMAAAVNAGCLDAVRVLAEHGAQIFASNALGRTVYTMARERDADTLAAILAPSTVAQQDTEGRTALHHAAANLDEKAISIILESGGVISVADAFGRAPLAATYQNPANPASARIAALLLLAGAVPLRNEFDYFETSIIKRNPSMRFEDGQTPLHLATRRGHAGYVSYLIDRKVPINVKDASSSTPLHDAVRGGNITITGILLSAGADPNQVDSAGNTPLHLVMPVAARSEIFNKLLSAGADPNRKDSYGETPLHITARLGMSDDIIKALLSAGADINERNKRGITPLSLAIERSQITQANLFITLGADIHAEDIEGQTAVTRAITAGIEMTKAVITETNIQARDSRGATPLHIAVQGNANPEILHYLISRKSDVNARNKNGESPLHIAVRNNDRSSGELLLAFGADVFHPNVAGESALRTALTRMGGRQDWILNSNVIKSADGAGNTPLHLAAEWQLTSVVDLILEKGGNPNARNANGETALFNAVKSDSDATIRKLLSSTEDKRADINARDFLGNSALHVCIRWSAGKAAAALISYDAQYNGKKLLNARNLAGKTPLHEAARQGNMGFLRSLLISGADINAVDETGKTALTDAIQANQSEVVILLLDRGASPVMQDMFGRNAYHEAVEFSSRDIITRLRRAGGNAMSRDFYGRTPLSLSFRKGPETVMAVIGTDTNIVDSDGNTPLHTAVTERASEDVLNALIAARFPVNNRNRTGSTALLLAVRSGQENLGRILLAAGSDPYASDNAGDSAVSIALVDMKGLVPVIAEFAADKTDTIGDSILHYAARIADIDTVKRLLTLPRIDRSARNVAGETARDIAVRWQRPEIAEVLR